jgi:hypothetical protein
MSFVDGSGPIPSLKVYGFLDVKSGGIRSTSFRVMLHFNRGGSGVGCLIPYST